MPRGKMNKRDTPEFKGNTAQLKQRRFAEILYSDFVAISCNTASIARNRASSVRKIIRKSLLFNYAVLP